MPFNKYASVWAAPRDIAKGILLCSFLSLMGCELFSSKPQETRDSGPPTPVHVAHIPDAVPKVEPRTIAGNKNPYRVLGKTYTLMAHPEGYKEEGTASWYGRKFHGRRTSNGEIYNMYAMTAAHKTLPIPSYVRVTNMANRDTVIVRVNDRGPFHGDRIIDLSYTAAKKLGFQSTGTARVTVEYIDPLIYKHSASTHRESPAVISNRNATAYASAAEPVPALVTVSTLTAQYYETREPIVAVPQHSEGDGLPSNTYLQVGAFSQETSATALKDELEKFTAVAVNVVSPLVSAGNLFKVHVGPFTKNIQLMDLRQRLLEANFPSPHVVYQ
ncbi:MAG: rare lipoprotein A [Lentisphaeria bacterium]|jgi:rare lipoprotein A